MQITKITAQLGQPGRYSIFVDGKYAFSLSELALLEQKLAPRQQLTTQQLQSLKRLSTDDKVYGRTLRYATLRPRSEWELQTYLTRKNVSRSVSQKILNKLSDIGLIDDRAFAETWVTDRRALKPVSRRRIKQELLQKHVNETIINEVVMNDGTTDMSVLKQLILKKRRLAKYQNNNLKLMQYLSRQGFNYDDIRSAVQEEV